MRRKGRVWLAVLLAIVGAVVGSALWSMLAGVLPAAMTQAVTFGTTDGPFTLDLQFFTLTLGMVLNVNIGGILGIAIAVLIWMKL